MKTQQAFTGRPMWQVSLMASVQCSQKRIKQSWVRVFMAVRPALTTSAFTSRPDAA
ncbi:MAG: hypothetical protein JWO71_230 [Candidatus Acidoferrum typicum]|nr:hypothetical protein [Candidatus Acidoferrum typicum]